MLNFIKIFSNFCTKSSIQSIPTLKQFIKKQNPIIRQLRQKSLISSKQLKFHIETYGCQMNVSDSEIVRSVLNEQYQQVDDSNDANIVFLNTCAIRQAAQQKIFNRIAELKRNKMVGILGCMAERLKEKMFDKGVQIVCGPDAYRDLPRLINAVLTNDENSINIQLSAEQTYADIIPIRKSPNNVSAFISIMRGCNNMCSFCIVPFVRGRERSRNIETILNEIGILQKQGFKQITFLGQNVNSYHDLSTQSQTSHQNSQGFTEMFKLRKEKGARFSDLLQLAAKTYPNIRFRFTSPHPKDFPQDLLRIIATYNNVCKYIHLPAQSGNTEMLFKMRRNHSRQSYIQLVQRMRSIIPDLSLSTDLICGFCGETQEQFEDTLSLIRQIKYDMAFLFAYSMREKTHAHRNLVDDIPHQVKQARLKKMIDTFVECQASLNQKEVNSLQLILIDGVDKRNPLRLRGKTDNFKKGYLEIKSIPVIEKGKISGSRQFAMGDYVIGKVASVGARSLNLEPIAIASRLSQYYENKQLINEVMVN